MTTRSQIKYQIFISSTYTDLITERQQAIKAILEMGHIPVGMEMFSAGDETQWQLIQRQIDDCDYYIVLLAHRYGSIDSGISYTEKEYNYAIEKSVPILAFILDDKTKWAKTKMDDDHQKITLLQSFKEKAKRRIIEYWKNPQDLKSKVAIALMKQFSINPRSGWIKSTDAVGNNAINEISRLSKENANLRLQLNEKESQAESRKISEIEKSIAILKNNSASISFYYSDGTEWEEYIDVKYVEIFLHLAPQLMIEQSVQESASYLGIMLNPTKRKTRAKWPIPSNITKGVLADFNILSLISHSSRQHEISDKEEYWTISDYGKEIYANLRTDLLEKGFNKTKEDDHSLDSNDA